MIALKQKCAASGFDLLKYSRTSRNRRLATRHCGHWLTLASAWACLSSTLSAQGVLIGGPPPLTTSRTLQIAPTERDNWYFTRVAELATDLRGQIFVLDDLACTIHVFDRNGRRIRALGRKGAGPGEFDRPRGLQVLGDTVFIVDQANARFVSFSTVTGAVIQTHRGAPGPLPSGLSQRGTFQLVIGPSSTTLTRKSAPVALVHRMGPASKPLILTTLPFERGYLSYPASRKKPPNPATPAAGGRLQTTQPFDDTPLFQVLRDGRGLAIVDRDAPSSSNGLGLGKAPSQTTIRVRVLEPNGKTVSDRTFTAPARQLSDQDIKQTIDSLAQKTMAPGVIFYARPSDIRDSLYIPRLWPSVTELFVGSDGAVWLRQPQPPTVSAAFWRLDALGGILPPVSVSSNLRILQVSNDRVFVAAEEIDGSPTVEVHRIVRK